MIIFLKQQCDCAKEGIENKASHMQQYCRDNGFDAWFETSAKENISIEEAAAHLVTKILENSHLIAGEARDESVIKLGGTSSTDGVSSKSADKKKGGGCC
jgi:hypothetical protein